jgi:hypothetical protein
MIADELLENHLEGIGETFVKAAVGNALTNARCCRMLRLTATLLRSNTRATRRGRFAAESRAGSRCMW